MLISFFQRMFKNPHLAELLRGGVYAVFFRGISFASGLLITSLVVTWYGLPSYGMYALVMAMWSVGAFAGRFGLDTVLNKLVTGFHQHTPGAVRPLVRKTLVVSLLFSLLTAILISTFSAEFALFFLKDITLTKTVQYTSWFIIPICAGMIFQGGLRALKKVKSFAFSALASNNLIILCLFPLGLVISDHEATPLVIAALAACVGLVVASLLWFKNTTSLGAVAETPVTSTSLILKTAFPVFLSSVWAVVNQYAPTFILGYFTNVSQVGLLEGTYRLSKLVNIGFFLVNAIAAAKFAELLQQGNTRELQQLLRQKALIISAIGVIVCGLLVCFPSFFLSLLNKEFSAASATLVILCAGQLVNALVGSVGILMVMAGFEKQLMGINFLGALVSIGLSFLLIPGLDAAGAALARSAGIILVNVICCVVVFRKTGLVTFYFPSAKKRKEAGAS